MYCYKCGKQIKDDSKFCSFCGTNLIDNSNGRNVFYDGDIHKCPNCGEVLKSFVESCPTCGYEIRGSRKNTKIQELADRIQKLNDVDKKIELISNFYVPNTKEDLIEFFSLAVSQIDDYTCGQAWQSKLDQVFIKAKLVFGNTDEYAYMLKTYKKFKRKNVKKSFKNIVKRNVAIFISLIAIAIGVVMSIIGGREGYATGDGDAPGYMVEYFGMMIAFGGAFALLFIFIDKDDKKQKTKKKNRRNAKSEYGNKEE